MLSHGLKEKIKLFSISENTKGEKEYQQRNMKTRAGKDTTALNVSSLLAAKWNNMISEEGEWKLYKYSKRAEKTNNSF